MGFEFGNFASTMQQMWDDQIIIFGVVGSVAPTISIRIIWFHELSIENILSAIFEWMNEWKTKQQMTRWC